MTIINYREMYMRKIKEILNQNNKITSLDNELKNLNLLELKRYFDAINSDKD